MDTVHRLWKQTITSAQNGDVSVRISLDEFTASAAAYVHGHGKSWQIEYLVGSADCLFTDRRTIGAEFLQDILANSRSLSEGVQSELKRQLAECGNPHASAAPVGAAALPDLTEASTHYQSVAVGVSGNMKGGGGSYHWNQESAGGVSPIAVKELAARLVPVNEPQIALQKALARLSPTARGATEEGIAVASLRGSEQEAKLTAECLKGYAKPLKSEFQIESSQDMITAYSVSSEQGVYEYALKLHGLTLPLGVLAYSVPDDMSLVSSDSGARCGSMAHELVHLLIKQNFPGAPAWLEEGLASEVAVAVPASETFRLGWSWRDQTLGTHDDLMPTTNQLLDMPWSALNAFDNQEARRAETNQAAVAVFIRYLDSKGKLPAIYFAVRDQHVSPDLTGFKSYREIVEQNLGMSVTAVDADFKRWFQAQMAANNFHTPVIVPPGQGPVHMNAPNAADRGCSTQYANDPPGIKYCPPVTKAPGAAATPTKNVSPNAPAEPSQGARPPNPN
jgi:hypothetical protein